MIRAAELSDAQLSMALNFVTALSAAQQMMADLKKSEEADEEEKAETEWSCDGPGCSEVIQEKEGQVTDDDEALFLCHACFESHEQKKAEDEVSEPWSREQNNDHIARRLAIAQQVLSLSDPEDS